MDGTFLPLFEWSSTTGNLVFSGGNFFISETIQATDKLEVTKDNGEIRFRDSADTITLARFQISKDNLGAGLHELYLFDCAGDPVFNQVEENASQYDQAGFLFVVYDVTKEDSFASCAKWIQGVRKGREDRLPGVLVANKVDLEERRVVTSERGRDFAKENGLVYFETSALQGNYEGPFRHVALEFAKKYEETVARAEDA